MEKTIHGAPITRTRLGSIPLWPLPAEHTCELSSTSHMITAALLLLISHHTGVCNGPFANSLLSTAHTTSIITHALVLRTLVYFTGTRTAST